MPASQYIGRRFDILAFRGASEQRRVELTQSLFDSSSPGEVCTGIQKVAQRFLLEFTTEQGSMGFHLASRGTKFVTLARQGRLQSELDVLTEYNFAAVTARASLLAEESEDWNPEDRFGGEELTQIELGDGWISLEIVVRNLVGDSREIVMPISVVPVNIAL